MIHMNSHQLLQLFPQDKPEGTQYHFTSVVIDSRKVSESCLFVAIKGDNFDGHQFVKKAAEQGAVAAIVDAPVAEVSIPQVVVKDTRHALAQLANAWRKRLNPLVIAITGSNGKTTVKEMLGQILSAQGQTLMTAGNFNNEIGVPLTLFQLSENDRYAVIEMGANHRHEISKLVGVAAPDVVYVNNARAAHIEGFGSLQAVIQAKGEMYQNADPEALAVFNDDEDSSDYWKSISPSINKMVFSSRQAAEVTASSQSIEKGLKLSLTYQQQTFECLLNVYGEHNAQNAVAAITLAIACGLTAEQACQALNGFSGVKGRQQFIKGVNECVVIDDSYNANPDSLAAAVKVLCALDGTPWLALGDMAEMGDESLEMHKKAVLSAKETGVEQFFALGKKSCQAAKQFSENGFCFSDHDEMVEFLVPRLHKDINLLVKGSRSAGMEKVVEKLTMKGKQTNVSGVAHAV